MQRTEEGHFRGRCLPYVRALTLLRGIVAGPDAVEPIVANLKRVWQMRTFYAYYDRPFVVLAALRAEALASAQHPLARAFATEAPDALAVTREGLVQALSPARTGLWSSLATRAPQTNEVSRAVVWKWPAELAGCSNRARPIGLVDVGASGGLNLIADRLPDLWEGPGGAPLRVGVGLDVRLRVAFDLNPLDFRNDRDVAWARACIWPGDVRRVERFERAVREWCASFTGPGAPPELHALNASLVPGRLPALFAALPANGVLFVYQTVMREYMDPAKRERYEDGMRRWLATVPRGRAAWLEAEVTPHPATLALAAHVPDGGGGVRSMTLALMHVHPGVVDTYAQAAAEFAGCFKPAG